MGVSVSIGATTSGPTYDGSHEDLHERADRACYQAKAAGGSRVLLLTEVR